MASGLATEVSQGGEEGEHLLQRDRAAAEERQRQARRTGPHQIRGHAVGCAPADACRVVQEAPVPRAIGVSGSAGHSRGATARAAGALLDI